MLRVPTSTIRKPKTQRVNGHHRPQSRYRNFDLQIDARSFPLRRLWNCKVAQKTAVTTSSRDAARHFG
ncbi:Uncharacterised protein [Vibrio cholerae]|nr:Uncharacterised protein [Vibrio cholerae]CSC03837.1 Uncharacterised protein [Vibrio cholerae]